MTLTDLHKPVQAIDYQYWERKAELMCETHPTSKADPKANPKANPKSGRGTEAGPKGKVLENPKPVPDMTGKLGKDGKWTPE